MDSNLRRLFDQSGSPNTFEVVEGAIYVCQRLFRLDFAADWSGSVVVTRGHDRPAGSAPHINCGALGGARQRIPRGHARGPPDDQIKQSTNKFISEARSDCRSEGCTCVGASSALTTSRRQAGRHHRPTCRHERCDGRRTCRGHRLAAALSARRIEPTAVAWLRYAL